MQGQDRAIRGFQSETRAEFFTPATYSVRSDGKVTVRWFVPVVDAVIEGQFLGGVIRRGIRTHE